MRALWPELLVLCLFLAGDILWNGMASAAAGVAAGLVSFLALLASGRRKPGLVMEGLLFGGITALGEVVSYPGGSLMLMELVLGAVLLLSAAFRWNVLERMAGGAGRGFLSPAAAEVLTVVMGGVFVLHSLIYALLESGGAGGVLTGAALFAALYLVGLKVSSGRIRKAEKAMLPSLARREDRPAQLVRGDSVLGELILVDHGGGSAVVESPSPAVPAPEFLEALESCLRREGFRLLAVNGWQDDEIELEIRGYIGQNGSWRKRLR